MPVPVPTTILFDLDGTICRYNQDPAAVVGGAFERAGVTQFCTPEQLWAAAGDVENADDDHHFLTQTFEVAAERHGDDASVADASGLARAYETVVDHADVSFRPGAEWALSLVRESCRVGLVTNGSQRTQTVKLESLGVGDAFETHVYAGDMSRPKPDPEPFEVALSDLESRPDDALYVGNSLEHDVSGAQGAGLRAAWFPTDDHSGDPGDHRPEFTFETLHDLGGVLEG